MIVILNQDYFVNRVTIGHNNNITRNYCSDIVESLQIKMLTNQKKIENIYNLVIVAGNKYKKIALETSTEKRNCLC